MELLMCYEFNFAFLVQNISHNIDLKVKSGI